MHLTDQELLPIDIDEATNLVIERSKKLVDTFAKQRGHKEPPFPATELAKLNGIKTIEKADLGTTSAILIKDPDGYTIKVNGRNSSARQNFSCAHEIGHTFLHELNRPLHIDQDEFRTGSQRKGNYERERLCDMAAAELLMPTDVFRQHLINTGISVNSIEKLANTFMVSALAVAYRIAELSPKPCDAIKWNPLRKTRSCGFTGYYAHKRIYIRNPSPLLKAYETNSSYTSYKSLDNGGIKKRFLMESKGFGRGETRYVISLIFAGK
jgi:Zn-dependent peptidase ImmA (M78 family)